MVDEKSLPPNSNVICGRLANALKNVITEKEAAKPGYVAEGYKNIMKPLVVHNTPTLRQISSKIILSCAFLLGILRPDMALLYYPKGMWRVAGAFLTLA